MKSRETKLKCLILNLYTGRNASPIFNMFDHIRSYTICVNEIIIVVILDFEVYNKTWSDKGAQWYHHSKIITVHFDSCQYFRKKMSIC